MKYIVETLGHLNGKVITGEVENVRGVDADGIGADPSYDVVLFPPGDPAVRAEDVRPTFFRWWSGQGIDTQAINTSSRDCWATVRDGRMKLWIPEGPAVFVQDCEEESP